MILVEEVEIYIEDRKNRIYYWIEFVEYERKTEFKFDS